MNRTKAQILLANMIDPQYSNSEDTDQLVISLTTFENNIILTKFNISMDKLSKTEKYHIVKENWADYWLFGSCSKPNFPWPGQRSIFPVVSKAEGGRLEAEVMRTIIEQRSLLLL